MAKNPFLVDDAAEQTAPVGTRENQTAEESPAGGNAAASATDDMPPDGEGSGTDGAPQAKGAEEPTTEPSARDKFRGRVSARYPDLNMDDEEAYYGQMGSMMDDYEGYEKNTEKLRDAMGKNPDLAEMLLAARDEENFNPVAWMVENKGVDLRSALDDPDFAETFAKAEQARKEKEAKGKEFFEEMQKNIGPSIDAQMEALKAAGISDDEAEQVMVKLFDFADNICKGQWDPQIGVLLAKGGNFDGAVASAKDEGLAEGLNTKVTDRVRKLNEQQEYVPGTQTPSKPQEPEKKQNSNPFLA